MAEIFAVILPEADESVSAALTDAYPEDRVHEVAPNVFLVHTDRGAADVVEKSGITYDPEGTTTPGVVFSLNGSYSGVYRKALWEWMGVRPTANRPRPSA